MKRILIAGCLLAGLAAWAGESLLGTIINADAGTSSNRSMCASDAGTSGDSNTVGCPTILLPFAIPAGTSAGKITLQCDQAAYVLTDVSGVDAGTGLYVAANEKFPTSVNSAKNLWANALNGDGGSAWVGVQYYGGWVSTAAVPGSALSVCRVYSRNGFE